MPDRHRLQRAEMEQRLEALLAAVAGALDPAEGQLDAAAGAEIVDEDLARFERLGEAQLASAILRPHPGDETRLCADGGAERLGLVGEAHGAEDAAEDLLLRQRVLRV